MTLKEFVDLNVLKKEINKFAKQAENDPYFFYYPKGYWNGFEDAVDVMKKTPKFRSLNCGHWVRDIAGVIKCSSCGHQAFFLRGYELFEYCPYCGSKNGVDVK